MLSLPFQYMDKFTFGDLKSYIWNVIKKDNSYLMKLWKVELETLASSYTNITESNEYKLKEFKVDEDNKVVGLGLRVRVKPKSLIWGAQDMLQREYGPYCVPKEDGYEVTLEFDLQKLPEDKSQREELVKKLALIKRNLMAQPFERAFEQQVQFEDEKQPPKFIIEIRKVFLQEFVDACRRPAIQNAPQVLYSSKELPLEIRHLLPLEIRHLPELQNTSENEDIGYVPDIVFRYYEDTDNFAIYFVKATPDTLQCHMFDVREIIDGKPLDGKLPLTLNPIYLFYYEDSDTLKIYFVDYMSPTSILQNNYVETELRMSK
ncbi:unnamed protein product [Rhizophagus irregularis]|nr:unnamed protein product [Rhizophagus irregularis]